MCVEIEHEGQRASNVGELRTKLGFETYKLDVRYEHEFFAEDHWCLCCLDIKETVKMNGFEFAEQPSAWQFGFKIKRATKGGA